MNNKMNNKNKKMIINKIKNNKMIERIKIIKNKIKIKKLIISNIKLLLQNYIKIILAIKLLFNNITIKNLF